MMPETGKKYKLWFTTPTGFERIIEVEATTEEEAIEKGRKEVPAGSEFRHITSTSSSMGARLSDWLPEVEGSPGIVVDEAVAKATPCTVYKVDTTEMAFSKGIIGTLSKGQIEAYCPTKIFKEEGIARRVKIFKEIAKKCSGEVREKYVKGERLIPYLKCMGKLAKEKEIEI